MSYSKNWNAAQITVGTQDNIPAVTPEWHQKLIAREKRELKAKLRELKRQKIAARGGSRE